MALRQRGGEECVKSDGHSEPQGDRAESLGDEHVSPLVGLVTPSVPRFAFSPANIFFTAELKGGDDLEELYCPEVEWEWGDGGKSVQEADCDPWTETTQIQRRFTSNHTFQFAGLYRVKITLRKSNKNIMSQTVNVTIRAGLGDTSPEHGE